MIGSLVQLDSAAEVLAGSLVALPEGCSRGAVRAEPAVADAVKAAARVVRAFRLPLGEALPGLRLRAVMRATWYRCMISFSPGSAPPGG